MAQGNTLVIEGSKMKLVLPLVTCIGFVAVGVFLIIIGEPLLGWVFSIFFYLIISMILIKMVCGVYLKLDGDGFEVNSGAKSEYFNWRDVDFFYMKSMYGNKMIGIKFSPSYKKMEVTRKISLSVSGMEGAINNQYKWPPEKVCECLNEWKARHGQEPVPSV